MTASRDNSDSDTEPETDLEVDSVTNNSTSEPWQKGDRSANSSNINIAAKKQAKVDLINSVTAKFVNRMQGKYMLENKKGTRL